MKNEIGCDLSQHVLPLPCSRFPSHCSFLFFQTFNNSIWYAFDCISSIEVRIFKLLFLATRKKESKIKNPVVNTWRSTTAQSSSLSTRRSVLSVEAKFQNYRLTYNMEICVHTLSFSPQVSMINCVAISIHFRLMSAFTVENFSNITLDFVFSIFSTRIARKLFLGRMDVTRHCPHFYT